MIRGTTPTYTLFGEVLAVEGVVGEWVQIDDTFQQAGQAADAAAVGTALNGKIAVQQGSGNAGKALVVGADGDVRILTKLIKHLNLF